MSPRCFCLADDRVAHDARRVCPLGWAVIFCLVFSWVRSLQRVFL